MKAFILKENISRYQALLDQEQDEEPRRRLEEMLASALREPTLVEARKSDLQRSDDPIHAAAQSCMFSRGRRQK
nr:hypothetical protein RTCK_00453 [Rhizobium sp. TCK]